MKVKRTFQLIFGMNMIVALLLAFVSYLTLQNQISLNDNSKVRYDSFKAAMELKQSSQDLTSYVRTYVSTADPIWEEKYFEVLDIRNGQKPRPDGKTIALKQIMKDLNFSDEEFAKMAEAEKNSNDLVWIETVAMRAVKGLYADENKGFTIKGAPNLDMARDLVFGKQYHAEVEKIMKPINEFFSMLDARTNEPIKESINRVEILMILSFIILAYLFTSTIVSMMIVNKKVLALIGGEPAEIENIAQRISRGDLNIDFGNSQKTGIYAAMATMASNIHSVINENAKIATEASNGNFNFRADANKFQGEYKEMVHGSNELVDAFAKPFGIVINYLVKISNGLIPDRVPNQNRKGDFIIMRESMNKVIDTLIALDDDAQFLANGAKEGKVVETRANADRHNGIYKHILEGFNGALDAISYSLSELLQVLDRLVQGDLKARMTKEYKGDFDVLKQNLNHTIDALPLDEIMDVMNAMAHNDLTVSMVKDYNGDNLNIKNAVNKTRESLNSILNNVKTTVDEVTHAAMQVSDTSSALSQGATEQASSLEQITSSMQHIASQTRQNAENASIANTLSIEARDAAENGNSEMHELNSAMNEIDVSSNNISRIMKVIDDIAFQTNLLALNAAVEAARAGRHGKGFAVVAEEVRSLAARSANAAKETSEMIEHSIKTADRGALLVKKTDEALVEIQRGTVKVSDIISEINTLSNEQAQGISQVNDGLSQIDRVTQTNTSSAEQTASAAEELSSQAEKLSELVNNFTLVNSGSHNYSMRLNSGSRGRMLDY